MKKSFKVFCLCFIGLYVVIGGYIDFFASRKPMYWGTIKLVSLIVISLLMGIVYYYNFVKRNRIE